MTEDERIKLEIVAIIGQRTQGMEVDSLEMRRELDKLEEDLTLAYASAMPNKRLIFDFVSVYGGSALRIQWMDK